MATIIKALAETRLTGDAASIGYHIYTPSPGQGAIIRNIRLVNTEYSLPVRVYVWCRAGSADRVSVPPTVPIPPVMYNIAPPYQIILPRARYIVPGEVTLGPGDLVQVVLFALWGRATLDLLISGVERDA